MTHILLGSITKNIQEKVKKKTISMLISRILSISVDAQSLSLLIGNKLIKTVNINEMNFAFFPQKKVSFYLFYDIKLRNLSDSFN